MIGLKASFTMFKPSFSIVDVTFYLFRPRSDSVVDVSWMYLIRKFSFDTVVIFASEQVREN